MGDDAELEDDLSEEGEEEEAAAQPQQQQQQQHRQHQPQQHHQARVAAAAADLGEDDTEDGDDTEGGEGEGGEGEEEEEGDSSFINDEPEPGQEALDPEAVAQALAALRPHLLPTWENFITWMVSEVGSGVWVVGSGV